VGSGSSSFSISITPPRQTVVAGATGQYTVQVTGAGGLTSGNVVLTAANAVGAVSFNGASSATVPIGKSVTMSVAVSPNAPTGSYPVRMTGMLGTVPTHAASALDVGVPGDETTEVSGVSGDVFDSAGNMIAGLSEEVTIWGQGFADGISDVEFSGPGSVTCQNPFGDCNQASGGEQDGTFSMASRLVFSSPGIYTVTVWTGDDVAEGSFQVDPVGPPACTVSIQANSSNTNTVILGTAGTLVISGACIANTTGVQIEGSGVTITGFYQTGSTSVTALYQSTSSNSPTLGTETVTVQTNSGYATGQIFALAVTLTSFSFSGSGLVPYSRDCVGSATAIAQPTWPSPTTDSSGNPLACPQRLGIPGDHAVYSAGQTMAGTATFSVNPPPLQNVPGVYVEGAAGAVGTFTGSLAVTISAGNATFSAPVTNNTALPTMQTQFYNPLTLNWSVGQAAGQTVGSCSNSSGGCAAVGSSSNPVYVTLAASVLPPTTPGPGGTTVPNPTMLTYVALAVGTGGAANPAAATASTWAQFSIAGCLPSGGSCPANVTTWDMRSMYYYTQGFSSCAVTAQQLVENLPTPSGQCGSFALLLASALAVNGIHTNWIITRRMDLPASPKR
jgi:hypothetical protein